MERFKGFLICTDCDGTLTNKEEKISEKNAEAIKYFQSEGGLFTLATGRTPEYIEQFLGIININAPMVSLNGTALYDHHAKKIIKTWTMHKIACLEVLSYIRSHWPMVEEYTISYSPYESTAYLPREHTVGDESLEKLFFVLPDELYKMLLIQDSDITFSMQRDLKSKFGDKFRFDASWANGLEIQGIDTGKGVAVQYLKDYLNGAVHTTIGVGDYENDITLFRYADISYAVGNAPDYIKKKADRVTVTNNESAIAAIISDLEKERGI